MITADKLKVLTELGPKGLAVFLERSGYTGCSFKKAVFVGITNGGQFAYKVTYHDDSGEGEEVGKVFISYDQSTDRITADF